MGTNYNLPFIFYYIIPEDPVKNIIMDKGIMTINELYKQGQFKLLDIILEQYRRPIIYDWGTYSFRDPQSLTRIEIINAITARYGGEFCNSIELLRYLPNKLGNNMNIHLRFARYFELDLNNIEMKKFIEYTPYKQGVVNNIKLNRLYFENVTKDEYFKFYRDGDANRFDRINILTLKLTKGFIPKYLFREVKLDGSPI